MVPASAELVRLRINGLSSAVARYGLRPEVLVIVASSSPEFLEVGRKVPTAAGYAPEQLVFRDAREADWKRGLEARGVVICDIAAAKSIPASIANIAFPLIAAESISELREQERSFRPE